MRRHAGVGPCAMACAMGFALAATTADARLLSATGGREHAAGVRRMQPLAVDRTELGRLRARERAVVHDVPLGQSRVVDLDLERFDPFAPGARVDVMGTGGRRSLPLPDN